MQHLDVLGKAGMDAYHAYLQSDHDYEVWAEVLTMEETLVGSVDLLDGQMNYTSNEDEGPDRTASVVLSDPEGALSFGASFTEDETGTLWVNRLLRVRHAVEVPKIGPRYAAEVVSNYVPNPTGLGDLTNVSTSSAPLTATISSLQSWQGDGKSFRVAWNTAPTAGQTQIQLRSGGLAVSAGTTVVLKFRFLAPATNVGAPTTANITMRDEGALLNYAVASPIAFPGGFKPGEWNEVTTTHTVPPGRTLNTVYWRVNVQASRVQSDVYYYDGLQVSPPNVPYFDGSTPDGLGYVYDWTGLPHKSRSTRTRFDRESLRVVTTCMVGVPTSAARSGGEVTLELGDKSLLADHGVRPQTLKKGMNVRSALIYLLRDLTGEHHLRIPATKKRLSQPYTVGMGEDALTPWRLAKRIAGKEAGWRLYYSGDGYATAEPTSTARPRVRVEHVLSLPDGSASFTDYSNYAKVTSKRKFSNKARGPAKKYRGKTVTFEAVAVLAKGHDLSEESLARHGVPRTLPLVVSDDDLKTESLTAQRAVSELQADSGIDTEQGYETMPFFHLDQGDYLAFPMGIGDVAFTRASVPFGTGGNASVGKIKWVSKPVRTSRVRSKATVQRKKKKGGRKRG
jgi:hypothetical protein